MPRSIFFFHLPSQGKQVCFATSSRFPAWSPISVARFSLQRAVFISGESLLLARVREIPQLSFPQESQRPKDGEKGSEIDLSQAMSPDEGGNTLGLRREGLARAFIQ